MQNLLLELMEFLIEWSVVASLTTLVTVGVSYPVLRAGDLYKRRPFLIGVPMVIAILVGASGPDDHTSLQQWAFFALPPLALAPLFVISLFRKRLKESKPSQT